mgnify:CR=1 FL=1
MDITEKKIKCLVCGINSAGFSLIYDRKTGQKFSKWGNFCSYGCIIQYNILDKSLSQCSTPNKNKTE